MEYEAALEAYLAREWGRAEEIATELHRACGDPAARVLAERAAHYREAPPAEGWDGAYTHTNK